MAHQATAEIPVVDKRRKRLLEAFYSGSRVDLWLELCEIAQEDLHLSQFPTGVQNRRAHASMERFLDDKYESRFNVLRLLLSSPDEVIEAMIWNTIGSKYATDPQFANLFYEVCRDCGVYLNTLLIKNRGGRGLTAREWSLVRDMIQRYMAGWNFNVPITYQGAHRTRAEEAKLIDEAYGSRKNGTKTYDVYKGERYWINCFGKTRTFWQNLGARVNQVLDPTLDVPQMQSPCEVGLSTDLSTRMAYHSTASNLTRCAKPWGLVLSCIKVMKIPNLEVEVVCVPVFKVWVPDMLHIGETAATLLSGSSVEDGGYNPSQPGVGPNLEPADYDRERMEVFVNNDWLIDNLTVAEAEYKKRKESVHALFIMDHKDFETEVSDLKENFNDLSNARKVLDSKLAIALGEMIVNQTTLNEKIEEAANLIAMMEENVGFRKDVDEWLDEED